MNLIDQIVHPKNTAFLSVEVLIIIGITFLISFIILRLLNVLKISTKTTRSVWDDVLIASLKGPIQMLIYVIGITLAFEVANQELKFEILKTIWPLKFIAIIIAMLWMSLNVINGFERHWLLMLKERRTKLDKMSIDAVAKLLRGIAVVLAGLLGLDTLGVNISGILAFGGAGLVAIGISAKDMLANFFGALMIYFDKPFKLGDYIKIYEKSIEGVVEKIGLRCTVIRTPEKTVLYVPNSLFSSASIENTSRMSHRRINETIGLRYEDIHNAPKVIADIKKFLTEHPEVDQDLAINVNLSVFSSLAIDIVIIVYINETDVSLFYDVKENIMFEIAKIIAKHKAEFAQYTNTLELPPEFYGKKRKPIKKLNK